MNVQKIFGSYIGDAKVLLEKEIEAEVEENLEHEREDAFATNILEYCDKSNIIGEKQKEVLKEDTIRKLEDQRIKIVALWELYINRTIMFSILFDACMYVGVIAAIIAFALQLKTLIFVFMIYSFFMMAISYSSTVYVNLCYFFTGTGRIIRTLFKEYGRYGKLEAKLTLADDCNPLAFKRECKKWLFTTSHKIAPRA